MKKIIALVVVAVVAMSGLGFWYSQSSNGKSTFQTTKVERGNLLATIRATGPLQPEESIDVGAQVTGRIKEFGREPQNTSKEIDYKSPVEAGTLLAKIDPAVYEAQRDQCKAQLAQADANVQRADADIIQMKAKLVQTERDWRRAQALGPNKANAISGLDYDTARAAYETAVSQLRVAEATLVQAQKAVDAAQASLKLAQTNLDYCTIFSPTKGVIVDRRVTIGQTVVSSMNASSLFLIAKDLSKMLILAQVNEADIGFIKEGQRVVFTVDTFKDEEFEGKVVKVRLNATMTQNVVTYIVEIATNNPDFRLLPYMTANVRFEVDERKDALLVPNSALRYRPKFNQIAPDAREEYMRQLKGRDENGVPSNTKGTAAKKKKGERGFVWVEDHGFLRPVKVRTGLTDTVNTEILSGDLKEGDQIVTREARAQDSNSGDNPFANKGGFGSAAKKKEN
jgi:HlyD family secretion protein